MSKQLPKNQRHIRWNFEASENREDWTVIHIVVVDDRDREGTIKRVLEQPGASFGGLEMTRESQGKVNSSEFRYLFRTYEGQIDPRRINWGLTGKIAVQDRDLRERKSKAYSIEEYVSSLYER